MRLNSEMLTENMRHDTEEVEASRTGSGSNTTHGDQSQSSRRDGQQVDWMDEALPFHSIEW